MFEILSLYDIGRFEFAFEKVYNTVKVSFAFLALSFDPLIVLPVPSRTYETITDLEDMVLFSFYGSCTFSWKLVFQFPSDLRHIDIKIKVLY